MGNVPEGCGKTPSAAGAYNQGAKAPADVTANGLIRGTSAPSCPGLSLVPASWPSRVSSIPRPLVGLRGPLKSSSVPGDAGVQSLAETGPHRGRSGVVVAPGGPQKQEQTLWKQAGVPFTN